MPDERLDKYRAICENIHDIAYIVDSDRQLTFVNSRFAEMADQPREQLEGTPLEQVAMSITDEASRVEFLDAVDRILEGEIRETKLEHPANSPVLGDHIAETRLTVYEPEGTPEGVIGTARDVTDRKASERQLQRERDRLDRFSGIVAHDLRNPLNVATGRLSLVRETCREEREQAQDKEQDQERGRNQEHLDAIETSLNRMSRIIDDMLHLSREGRDIGATEPIDPERVATAAWESIVVPEAEFELVRTDDHVGLVLGDADRLTRLFENLFRNAVEHDEEPASVRVELFEDGFAVEDTGPGIPEAERDRVFDSGYSISTDGTGYGLSIVRQIVDAHGWSIDVTDGDDGARFEITGIETVGR
ncbi:PAS domain-containing protein [Natronorubrum sp. JWXQ-INN-674]|uniref:histidine kinase n=1 Tax=Natronorubrum halalkaliphilum TaxID=2691917 RepID=A0A6B0VJ80_9EURY|nr:PAS domain-containing sensor histidine kinase [Natronorubrum halalkaliphilum]MXV60852.1 PAS domain-containing protein [Natronorubrum halalkaliphilum]